MGHPPPARGRPHRRHPRRSARDRWPSIDRLWSSAGSGRSAAASRGLPLLPPIPHGDQLAYRSPESASQWHPAVPTGYAWPRRRWQVVSAPHRTKPNIRMHLQVQTSTESALIPPHVPDAGSITTGENGEPSVSKFPTRIVIIGVSVSVIIIVVLLAFPFFIWRRCCKPVPNAADNPPPSPMRTVPALSLLTLKVATDNFSNRNIIGEGGFCIVYKGKLRNGTDLAVDVAVKRLKRDCLTDKGRGDFLREVEVMSTLTHVNLAELLYYCQDQEGDEWILVYEWMEKKSLNRYIFGEDMPRSSPNWEQRLEIIRGVAVGVEFLHSNQVIHRDLKPGNILLDDSWKPKIADFATAKLFIADQTDPTVVLTPGYVAPEYAGAEPTLTYKCDVYSFGVVLLEIVTGRRRTSMPTFLLHAWELWNRHDIEQLLDQEVGEPGELLSALARCIQIGLLCVQHLQQPPEEGRPAMSKVVKMLTGTDSHSQLPMPSRPTANSGAGPSVQLTPRRSRALSIS